jgi:hypothetical protein
MVAADPYQGGATWAVLQYLLGLRRVGCQVYFIEPILGERLQPAGVDLAHSTNADYFRGVMAEFGLSESSALLLAGTRETTGLSYGELRQVAARADLLLNVSGMLSDWDLIGAIPCRAYLDLDPAFVQLWQDSGIDMRFEGHTHFVTVGMALGTPGCPIPTCGREWLHTTPPVVLEHWPVSDEIHYDGLTTIANWRGYGSVEHEGVFYGQKAHSWRNLMALPTMTSERLLPALAIHEAETTDLQALRDNGWQLLDALQVANTPGNYRRFIQLAKGELGIAKSGYVASRCGWFSDRSVCFLASGKPVLAQDTGFTRFLPVGEGLLSFQTVDDLLPAIDSINRDYCGHARAARRLAEQCFDSDKVLPALLQRLGVP